MGGGSNSGPNKQIGGMSKWKLQSMQFRMAMQQGKQVNSDSGFQSQAKPSFSGLTRDNRNPGGRGSRPGGGKPSGGARQQAPMYSAQEMAALQ